MPRRCWWIVFAVLLSNCARGDGRIPENLALGPARALPAPLSAPNDAPPRILAIHLSSARVRRGGWWSGRIITTTNVASVEVRTSLFSIDVPRKRYGDFVFSLHVIDVPPIFIRAYRLRVIARNSAGSEQEEDVPLRIQ